MIFVLWIVMGATLTLALGMLIGRVGMAPAKVTGTVIIVFWLVWLTLGVGGYRSDPVAKEGFGMNRHVDRLMRNVVAEELADLVAAYGDVGTFQPRADLGLLDPSLIAWHTAERLIASRRPELVTWGRKIALAFGVVHAKDFLAFVIDLETRCNACNP